MVFRIIGNGAFGTALMNLFYKNAVIEDSLGSDFATITGNDYLVMAVPSDVLMLVLDKVLKFGVPKCIIIVSKGLFNNKLLLDNLTYLNIPLVYLAGPNLAKEMQNSLDFLSITLAGEPEHTNEIKENINIIVDETQDVVLPQVASILKNTTAFTIGFLNTNENARATLIMQGMKEAVMLAKALGSTEDNLMRACFSDFILTCTSLESRNYKAGVDFKSGNVKSETQESLKSSESIKALANGINLPVFDFFYNVVNNKSPDIALLIKEIKAFDLI